MVKLNPRKLDREIEAAEDEAVAVPRVARFTPRAEGILNVVREQEGVDGYVREISRLWGEARDKFLAIGEYLILAKRQLQHGEYEEMLRSRLPFDVSVGRKMRAVAQAVQDNRLARAVLPNSYATAYELTLLSDEGLELAQRRNLLRPDVPLREIKALRAELSAPLGENAISELRREEQAILRDLARLRLQLRKVRDKLKANGIALADLSDGTENEDADRLVAAK